LIFALFVVLNEKNIYFLYSIYCGSFYIVAQTKKYCVKGKEASTKKSEKKSTSALQASKKAS